MDVGQVGFYNEKLRFRINITRDNSIVKKINKTKVEAYYFYYIIKIDFQI